MGARKGSRKKPKLTVENLTTKPMGFAYLLTDLADDFRRVYKGPGHEVKFIYDIMICDDTPG